MKDHLNREHAHGPYPQPAPGHPPADLGAVAHALPGMQCGGTLWVAYQTRRTLTTLEGRVRLNLTVRRCHNPDCKRYHRPYRPAEEGGWALPQSEAGLDVVALVGALRCGAHRSVPEVRQRRRERGVLLAERTVTNLVYRYEELVALRLADQSRLREKLRQQGRVLLARDGLAPDVGHAILWVLRDCLSGEVLLARSLLSATEAALAALITEVQQALLPVPIVGVVSDGQWSIRTAVRSALPGVPHQLCQFHYLCEAAKPIYEADRHAKKELKKQVRGVRPSEQALEGRPAPKPRPPVPTAWRCAAPAPTTAARRWLPPVCSW